MAEPDLDTFAGVKTRLNEIVDAVSDDGLSLDDALVLYEEAVALGLRASDLLEADISAGEIAAPQQEEAANGASEGEASADQEAE